MKKNIVNIAVTAALTIGLASSMSGCVGSNAVTAKLMKFNVEAVDNRYGRGGLNILLSPIYAITVAADYIVFNSIEFWAGKNPLNGNPHIFDSKVKTMIEINDDLDPSLTDAPLDPITKVETSDKEIYSAKVSEVNESTLDFEIVYTNGESVTLRGEKEGDMVSFYLDGTLITKASMTELQEFSAPKA